MDHGPLSLPHDTTVEDFEGRKQELNVPILANYDLGRE